MVDPLPGQSRPENIANHRNQAPSNYRGVYDGWLGGGGLVGWGNGMMGEDVGFRQFVPKLANALRYWVVGGWRGRKRGVHFCSPMCLRKGSAHASKAPVRTQPRPIPDSYMHGLTCRVCACTNPISKHICVCACVLMQPMCTWYA